MAEPGTFERVMAEVGLALLPLREAVRSPERFSAFLIGLGWLADELPQPLADLGVSLDTLHDELRLMLGDDGLNLGPAIRSAEAGAPTVTPDRIARVLDAVQRVIGGVRAIADAPADAIPESLRAEGFATEFPRQLLDYLLVTYLQRFHPQVAFALRALGVIRAVYSPQTDSRPAHTRLVIDIAELPTTLRDPELVLRNAFGWGTEDFDFAELASQVDNLLSVIGVATTVERVTPTVAGAVIGEEPADQPAETPSTTALSALVLERVQENARMSARVRLVPLPGRDAALPGFAILPAFDGLLSFAFALTEGLTVTIRSDLDLQGGVGLLVRPGEPIGMIVGFNDETSGAPVDAKGSIEVRAERAAAGGVPTVILGAADGTRLQVRAVGGAGGVRLSNGTDIDVYAEIDLRGLEFVLDAAGADGFLAALIPDGGLAFGADLAIGVSHRDGFYFRGTSHLELELPAHARIGPVEILSLTVAANPTADGLPVVLGATFAATLGPVRAVVERVGLTAEFGLRSAHDGNLGPLDVALRFTPPRGIGLAINAGAVTGGGFLAFDSERGEYAGALELAVADLLTLSAIGLISTRMPDGTAGFSLVALVATEFARPIEVGLGFRVTAVGGLLGLNRGMDLAALTDGVRSGALQSVMFPADLPGGIVANAPKIISDLRTFFPARPGTFLIGPMAKLEWGSPTLVHLSLGVIIEIPGDIAVLGVLSVAMPADDYRVVELNVHFIGAIEFDRKRLYFFASLYRSRIAYIPIEGELGVLVAWGDDADLIVSIGGFHPGYTAPPLPFPTPRRISLDLLNTSVARVRAEGYLAITSNTVQFGAKVEVFLGFSAFSVSGHVGFDALFRSPPFKLVADFSASLSVKVFGAGLFSVRVRGTIDGPHPWHLVGHGSISLLFWDFDVDVEKTWGDPIGAVLASIAALPLLIGELAKPDAWRALPPTGSRQLVTVREQPSGDEVVLHPSGGLRISQRALPLDVTLDRIGNARPADVKRLGLTSAGGVLAKRGEAFERFAAAQFRDLSDAQKLSQPAFTPEHAGLELAADGAQLRTSGAVRRAARYEEIIIDANFTRAARPRRPLGTGLFDHFLAGAAVTRAAPSRAVAAAFAPVAQAVAVTDETFTVAFQDTNRAYAADATGFASAAQAREYAARRVREDPTLAARIHVIPEFEAAP